MTMHKQHPQRCLHSHICKWNKDNYRDCIDTDCASHRYTYNYPYQSSRDKVLDIGEVLESLCNGDLTRYTWGEMDGEDVGKCCGKTCNYCGRYTEELRQKAGEQ